MNYELRIKKFKNTGFTLVETLVSISIFTVSLLGLMSVLASGISNTNYAKNKTTASYLAQEGIEYVRNMRDSYVLRLGSSGWNQFRSNFDSCNSGSECGFNNSVSMDSNSFIEKCNQLNGCALYINNGGYSSNGGGVNSGFVRKIYRDQSIGGDEVKIFIKVEWTQGSGNYSVIFSENLFNWIE